MTKNSGLAAKGMVLLFATTAFANPIENLYRELLKRDEPPRALDEHCSEEEKKWQPALDFDKDSCYNVPAIDKDGNIATGDTVDYQYSWSDKCRDIEDLDNNNVYVRTRCNNHWCGYLYDYYFERDQSVQGVISGGHRHDWEHIAVFTKDNEGVQVVAASAHGDYDTKKAGDVRFHEDTHAKIVYHKDGGSTHAFRFASEEDDEIENHKGYWFVGPLVNWEGFPSGEIRDKLMNHDFGDANVGIKDGSFKANLDRARNDLVDGFNSG
ncbi:Hypothetical protein NCS54_00946800 [Fusarium falciforme]|uniref:Hypothetical protein n=1 Tax=Fusarium falciforme TaxID=195108 RepID=UPI002300430F|nr:Hypothetical protein NCS54_00946800 [Fusarium falciforme]WAO91981.1 Hypothetical protein NCS54_00946800 [Fusarium falciforme]